MFDEDRDWELDFLAKTANWPDRNDISQAFDGGIGYAEPDAAYLEGRQTRQTGKDLALRGVVNSRTSMDNSVIAPVEDPIEGIASPYLGAKLASATNPLLRIGLDPDRTIRGSVIDETAGLGGRAGGVYNPNKDTMYTSNLIDNNKDQSGWTMAHEATHRAFKKLRDDPEFGPEIKKFMTYDVDERFTQVMGTALNGMDTVSQFSDLENDAIYDYQYFTASEKASILDAYRKSPKELDERETMVARMVLLEEAASRYERREAKKKPTVKRAR